MIWFTCKQCGKRHGRPDEMAGSLLFCECGHGNRVPWESTAAAPELPKETPTPSRPTASPSRPRWAPRPQVRPRDPTRCLNHEDVPAAKTCAVCGASFCERCIVSLQGQSVCGPCKNYRLHYLTRPARLSSLALIAMLLGLFS